MDGRIHFDNRKLFDAALKTWDGRVTVTIAPDLETRREKQNRYYHGVVVKMIADDTGQPRDDVHEWLKLTFNGETIEMIDPVTGEETKTRIGRSTAKLKVQPFCDYVEMCKVWAAEFLGIVIPEADPDYWRKSDTERAA